MAYCFGGCGKIIDDELAFCPDCNAIRLEHYDREVEVEFEGEKYRVRDNGAVYRMHRPDRRRSRFDEIWTFGRLEKSTRYMKIGPHTIHRIVAFAFCGAAPSKRHVVDHIDTNRGNNCAANIRWITRLDNLIRHPSTRKQIISAYGSLDKFFENPGAATQFSPNIDWVRTVSKEEAESSREQLQKWAEEDGLPKDGDLGNRVYGTLQPSVPVLYTLQDKQSLTPMAVQRRWQTPTEFPCCPIALGPDPLAEYARNLHFGAIFARDRWKKSTVLMAEQRDAFLCVLTAIENPVKPWAVAKVTVKYGKFVHESIRSFDDLNDAKQEYYQLLDIPFSGESIDD